jgi:predicted PurR-regulated permease PerM
LARPPRRPNSFIHPEQDRRLRSWGLRAWAWIGILLLAAMLYTGFSLISGFVIPLIVAVVLGMIFEPVANVLGRVMPRQAASLTVLIGLGVLVAVAVGVVVAGIIDQGPEIIDEMQSALDQLRQWLVERGIDLGSADDLQRQLTVWLDGVLPGLVSYVPDAFSSIGSFLASSFIAIFILYFVIAEWDTLAGWVGSHLGVPQDLGEGIVEDATRSFRDYFYVLTLSSLPVALVVGLAAWVMGIPLAFTIGLITFITSYVPYLGALVSSVFALLIAFGSGGPVVALVILVVILVAQNVIQPIIQKQLERNTLDLHPIVSFGSTIIGAVFFGILGATLSAPTVAMVMRVRTRIRAFELGGVAALDELDEHDDRDDDDRPVPPDRPHAGG